MIFADNFELKIGTLTRALPIVKINETTAIASFVMLGDVELIERCAQMLSLKLSPGFDVIAVPEAKAIPLAHAIARISGGESHRMNYCVMRKSRKTYFRDELSVPVKSITTANEQRLYLDAEGRKMLSGKKVCLIDDVVSTGGTFSACAELIKLSGGILHQCAAVLVEGAGGAPPERFRLGAAEPFVHLGEIPVWSAAEKAL